MIESKNIFQCIIECLKTDNLSKLRILYSNYLQISKPISIEQELISFSNNKSPIINAHGIKGLIVIPDFLSICELDQLQRLLSTLPLSGDRGIDLKSIYYGSVGSDEQKSHTTPPLLKYLVHRIHKIPVLQSVTSQLFNQISIIKYVGLQQRSFCRDDFQIYGDAILCFIIGDNPTISFKDKCKIKHIKTNNRSIYLLTDQARYHWCYGVKNNTPKPRYSIIIRKYNGS